ncbi:STAS/SEC14 domain-containing protein [Bacillus daqingensis]|uniref:STAS/SEC14 domain-containing protein n=1 Tax=Bacillus daqingensis TaxID=872396 RepID=A0ABV9NZT8_9BACI
MIHMRPQTEGNYVEYEAEGKLTEEEHERVFTELKERIHKYGTIRLLVVLPEFPSIEASAVNDRLRFAKEHLSSINKYALVTDSNTAAAAVTLYDKLAQTDFQTFSPDELKQARTWVKE